jgi:hypothetical protein
MSSPCPTTSKKVQPSTSDILILLSNGALGDKVSGAKGNCRDIMAWSYRDRKMVETLWTNKRSIGGRNYEQIVTCISEMDLEHQDNNPFHKFTQWKWTWKTNYSDKILQSVYIMLWFTLQLQIHTLVSVSSLTSLIPFSSKLRST